jgi:hypothetical protein
MLSTSFFGWALMILGVVLWTYGYLMPTGATWVDWKANTPWWISDYIPSKESELGLALMCIGMVPLYWPTRAA